MRLRGGSEFHGHLAVGRSGTPQARELRPETFLSGKATLTSLLQQIDGVSRQWDGYAGRAHPGPLAPDPAEDEGAPMSVESPPVYAWDWLARQRVVWNEMRRRLLSSDTGAGPDAGDDAARGLDLRPHGASPATAPSAIPAARATSSTKAPRSSHDVPDWAADHPDLQLSAPAVEAVEDVAARHHDYRTLDTRAEVVAALRIDYPSDARVRRTVDAVVAEVAFLGRLDIPLHELGVRAAPRGMRWWWCHLGGNGIDDGRTDGDLVDGDGPNLPTQLRLVDVLAGYGDVSDL